MARGRLFSRNREPKVPQQHLESSPNPLVQLGLTFKKLQKLAPETEPSVAQDDGVAAPPERRPLLDIDDVRKYLRHKLAITKTVSTIPMPNPNPNPNFQSTMSSSDAYESSETTHTSSTHAYSSDSSSLPQHDAASGANVFDIGTVGHPILEVSSWSSSSSAPSSSSSSAPSSSSSSAPSSSSSSAPSSSSSSSSPSLLSTTYTWILDPPGAGTPRAGQLDMRDVQEFVRGVVEVVKTVENWGLPRTSWENKMPWHSPPPKRLARGLQPPPKQFASDEERLAFNRLARKRRKFLTGCPPTWSFMVANLALVAFLLYNPLGG